MSLKNKVQILNFMVADYAVKSHLYRQYREAEVQINGEKSAEIEKMTGSNSAISIKLREAILAETNGDFSSYFAKKVAPELNALDLADMYLKNTSGDQLSVNFSTKISVPSSISVILEERNEIAQGIRDSFAEMIKKTDEYLALTAACDASEFKNIDPFNCVMRSFAYELGKAWGGAEIDGISLSHACSKLSPSIKPVSKIAGRYVGMGEHDYFICFSDEQSQVDFWSVKWGDAGKPVAQFQVA